MKQGNRISAAIKPADKTAFIQTLKELSGRLDFLITLQPEESQSLRKIGIDGVPYALAGRDAVRASLDFTRRSFDLDEYEQDVTLFQDLGEILAVLNPLRQRLEDTYRLVGADVMVTADDIYEDLRNDNGETAAVQAPLQQMRKRYQYRNGAAAKATKATKPTTPNPDAA
ncbi:hypothetical protein [Hymenobacter psychrotolerans]|uniref:Uncharacterized protein n=1 Tax=Hymenobacter psychrotolerans DSM 18569 TaxID=1121959 RepID=A0A1M6PK19_9BACT|nr:hypothetical protein [Hymenobacter psychrotolerans]SHK08258.1 hypothetical protein SAMN02746009_00262 [Hymenobacter psychrotolerans DSM 18569]